MDTSLVIRRIEALDGVERLNAMQQAVADMAPGSFTLLAPTGSGKTLAMAIALLRSLGREGCGVQAVVLTPSRELTVQVGGVLAAVGRPLRITTLYGGHSMADEARSLAAAVPDIIIATPGRLLDHIQRGQISIDNARTLVIDEFDKALELGFLNTMERIGRRLRHIATVILTSATAIDALPPFAAKAAQTVFDYRSGDDARPRITVYEVPSPQADKLDTLVALLLSVPRGRTIVFANHRESAERIYAHLRRHKLPAGLYHGALDQRERQQALILFDNGTTPVLVSTDLAARGLDIDAVQSIIHYHLPVDAATWLHRNGRSARQGATGDAYIITSPAEHIPGYIDVDATYTPATGEPWLSDTTTLYFNAGRREKLSRGDIVGFLIAQCGLEAAEIGRVTVLDHCAYAAVPATKAPALSTPRIKSKRIRMSEI